MKRHFKLFTIIACLVLLLALTSCNDLTPKITIELPDPYSSNSIENHINHLPDECPECKELETLDVNDDDCIIAVACELCLEDIPVVSPNHEGGVATCVKGKVCEICRTEYSEKDASNHISTEFEFVSNGDATHTQKYKCCGAEVETSDCTYENGRCTVCGVLGGFCGGEGDGTNLVWTLKDGALTILGEGAMANYNNDAPWYEYNHTVTSIIVGDGVTTIGDSAFYLLWDVTKVNLPDSVNSIGARAFYLLWDLKEINISSNVTFIGDKAFYGCDALTVYCEMTEQPSTWSAGWNVVDYDGTQVSVVWK